MIIKIFFTTCTILISTLSIHAQPFSTSPYSIYGAGTMQEHLSGLNSGMGGAGIGVQESFNLNHVNPASYGSIVQPVSHIFEVGLYASSNRLSTFNASESKPSGGL